jgi:hypothetical protein
MTDIFSMRQKSRGDGVRGGYYWGLRGNPKMRKNSLTDAQIEELKQDYSLGAETTNTKTGKTKITKGVLDIIAAGRRSKKLTNPENVELMNNLIDQIYNVPTRQNKRQVQKMIGQFVTANFPSKSKKKIMLRVKKNPGGFIAPCGRRIRGGRSLGGVANVWTTYLKEANQRRDNRPYREWVSYVASQYRQQIPPSAV